MHKLFFPLSIFAIIFTFLVSFTGCYTTKYIYIKPAIPVPKVDIPQRPVDEPVTDKVAVYCFELENLNKYLLKYIEDLNK